ncbi:flagellin N-terminal helical domain-containing protein [Nocardioides nematodiphilus]|uniref:flagellin N-terminal helical domain-containing protein n=1 Tax=Nocardioides nematodiphilus TaxID=2849669 RepID=UPI001CD9BA6D|nr:flagellin [Nocardioides nematodiphilus]MCA1984226.1 flagellin [Nocardioides nematodiphilus]
MSLRINTNVDSLTAYRNLNGTQSSMSTSIERLSSGLRINKAADDAAGLAISQGLTAQINGLGQAVRNAQDGINVVQTADGALTEVQSILQRSRQLVVQGANDSNDSYAKTNITTELKQLSSELDRIKNTTEFNGKKLLDGSADLFFQVGSNSKTKQAGNQIEVSITDDLGGSTLLGAAASLSGTDTAGQWSNALDDLDTSLRSVSTLRANLGAYQNRFQHTINNLSVTQTNLQASNSAILDTDMAQEMSNYSRTQILSQAGTSMLKQANQAAQSVLSLLG